VLVDLVVETGEQVVAEPPHGHLADLARLVPVGLADVVDDRLDLFEPDRRVTTDGDAAVRRGAVTELAGDEEVQLAALDRAAEREREALVGEVAERGGLGAVVVDVATGEALVATVVGEGPVEVVGPRLRDRVDARAGEAALADVEGRDDDLELLDRLHR